MRRPAQPGVKNAATSLGIKTGSGLVLGVALAAGLLWSRLPITVKRSADVARGEQLRHGLARYRQQYGALPATDGWTALKQTGFRPDELEQGYPQYTKLTDSTYQLVFVTGFDGPYLLWNSQEQKWKENFMLFRAAKR